jgi:hypothetical protein
MATDRTREINKEVICGSKKIRRTYRREKASGSSPRPMFKPGISRKVLRHRRRRRQDDREGGGNHLPHRRHKGRLLRRGGDGGRVCHLSYLDGYTPEVEACAPSRHLSSDRRRRGTAYPTQIDSHLTMKDHDYGRPTESHHRCRARQR